MSFTYTYINHSSDVSGIFRAVSESFLQHYYSAHVTNQKSLSPLYLSDAKITVMGKEIVGYYEISRVLKENRINCLNYQAVNGTCQPIDPNAIMITTHGKVQVNVDTFATRFIETFVLRRDNNGTFYVTNQVLDFVD